MGPGECSQRTSAAGATESSTQRRIAKHCVQPLGERGGIFRRNQVTGLAVENRRAYTTDCAADHWARAGHGFQRCNSEWLVPRCGDENVRRVVVKAQLTAIAPPDEMNLGLDAEVARQLAQPTDFWGGHGIGIARVSADDM